MLELVFFPELASTIAWLSFVLCSWSFHPASLGFVLFAAIFLPFSYTLSIPLLCQFKASAYYTYQA